MITDVPRAWGWQTLFNTIQFKQKTQTPNGTQNIFVSLPSLKEWESSKGLLKNKEAGRLWPARHRRCALYMPRFPSSSPPDNGNKVCHDHTAIRNTAKIWTHISCLLEPKSFHLCQAVSHRNRKHAPKEKARGLSMDKWKPHRYRRLCNGHFPHRINLVLSLNQTHVG